MMLVQDRVGQMPPTQQVLILYCNEVFLDLQPWEHEEAGTLHFLVSLSPACSRFFRKSAGWGRVVSFCSA
jgi:hypothetical protein